MTRTLVATGEDGIEGVVPATLYGCLMARLDRDPDARAVAQAAAAIGRRFDTDLLGPLAGLEDAELRERLDTLVADDLLVEQRGDAGVRLRLPPRADPRGRPQQPAARAPPGAARQDRRPAGRGGPRVAEEQPEVLAGHLEAAERFGEAIGFRLAAALRSLQGSSYQEADLHLEPRDLARAADARRPRARRPRAVRARAGGRDADRDPRLDGPGGRGALPARAGDRRARRRRPAAVPGALRAALLPDRQRAVRRRRGDGPREPRARRLDRRPRASSSRPRSSWATS